MADLILSFWVQFSHCFAFPGDPEDWIVTKAIASVELLDDFTCNPAKIVTNQSRTYIKYSVTMKSSQPWFGFALQF